MADALLSPIVGGAGWSAAVGLIAISSGKIKSGMDERRIPLMGVLGAFIFAAQMINFTIPATGSSGHIGGALLLSILLGPYGAFLTIASVLTLQAFIFADGGILALGCNIINLGFFPCFIAYGFIYKPLAKTRLKYAGIFIAAIVGLQLGSFGVVTETYFSGISGIKFYDFLLLMQPVHLAIGAVEGVLTVLVVSFVTKANPQMIVEENNNGLEWVMAGFLVCALVLSGVVSMYASSNPDGLEWAIAKTSANIENTEYASLANIQNKTSIMSGYQLKDGDGGGVAGIAGSTMTLILVAAGGILIKKKSKR